MANKFYTNAPAILSGSFTLGANPVRLNPNSLLTRRILLVCAASGSGKVSAQGQPAASGFPIPNLQADGNYVPLELLVTDMNLVFVSGSGTLYWYVEMDANQP